MPQQYIPIDDAKQIVEKPVKPKPSTDELTTVESPGKPVPQSLNSDESESTKKPRKRKKPATTDIIKDVTPKDYILIITEKPQSAQKIAQALGSPRKYSENRAPYFEVSYNSQKIIVASAVGHLFNLTYTPGQKGWPIFNTEWQPSYTRDSAAFTKSYYDLLKKLSKKAKEFIIATDYDIEGEVIGWNIIRFIANKQTAKRMKYSTLTKPELLKSFQSLMPELDWGQAYAGETRHILDWLYGINLSRALMSALKTTDSFKIMSIGRVQGPALKIIVDREHEIANFKSRPYWQVFAIVNKIPYKHPKDIFDKSELSKFKDIREAIAQTKTSEEKINPPPPFDLTTLQRESYRLHKISPSQTLKIAQKLYLDGLISYPRTSSQKIPDVIQPKKILKALEKHFPNQIKHATRLKPIEGKKSDPAHPSIYPTGEFQPLSEDFAKIFHLIVKRFISAFSPDAITENKRTTLTATSNPKLTFTASGLHIKEKGWTLVYPTTLEEKSIPTLKGKVKIDKIKIDEKETQPPRRYTPTSLITLLEKKNLGTKSTRSMIVDILFDRGYLDGKSIKATPLGLKLIESLEKYSPIIIDENLTRELELQMEKLQTERDPKALQKKETELIEKAKRLISDISKEFKSKEAQIGKELAKGLVSHRKKQQESNTIMPCPKCKKGNLRILYSKKTNRYFAACTKYPECTETHSLPPNALIKTTGKVNESGLPILVALKKGKRPWEFPFNVNWREENQKKDQEQNNKKEN